jgi:methyl-accepting chemotaxis protein
MNMVAVASLLRAQMTADMKRDATKSNVLYALYITTGQQISPETRREVLQKFQDDRKTLEDNIAILDKANLNDQTPTVFTRVKPDVARYLSLADKIVNLAFQDHVAAQAQLPMFTDKFDALENSLAQLGDDIEGEIKITALNNDNASKTAQRLIIITALMAC